jgi:hypothetical protein
MAGLSPSFRGDAKHRTRNLEIPGSRFARPGMTEAGRSAFPFTRMVDVRLRSSAELDRHDSAPLSRAV